MIQFANVLKKLKMQCIFSECQRYDIRRTALFNATRNFHPLSINILLSGNPDLSDQDNHIIFDAVHSFI